MLFNFLRIYFHLARTYFNSTCSNQRKNLLKRRNNLANQRNNLAKQRFATTILTTSFSKEKKKRIVFLQSSILNKIKYVIKSLVDFLKPCVLLQSLRNIHSCWCLMIFQQRCNDSRQSQSTTIQSMSQNSLSFGVFVS